MIGWIMPLARIEAASSSSRSCWKTARGCTGLAVIWLRGRVAGSFSGAGATAGAGAEALASEVGLGGSRAERPLPSGLRVLSLPLLIFEDFLGQFDVAFGPARTGIVHQDGLAVAGRFGEPNTSWDDRLQNLLAE